MQSKNTQDKKKDIQEYLDLQIGKEEILKKLRDRGNRITLQREKLIELILESESTCCKEIYYRACKKKLNIGLATIYRFLNTLEEIGAIKRKNTYQICNHESRIVCDCIIEYHSGKKQKINRTVFYQVVESGIKKLEIGRNEKIKNIVALSEEIENENR